MADHRLTLARESGVLELPDEGRIAAIGLPGGAHLDDDLIPRLTVEQPLRPDYEAVSAAGTEVSLQVRGPVAVTLVQLPRARALGQQRVALAWEKTEPGGLILVDGQKTDGIESMQRDLRKRLTLDGSFSKAHGKLLWFRRPDTDPFADWRQPSVESPEGFVTMPGVFSAEAVDQGSRLLLEHLPALKGAVADLGAGWGYLSRGILRSDAVSALDLVEADAVALDCARQNVTDPRAEFHWADATRFEGGPYDAVVTNPPFHSGRAAEPALGTAFIIRAARLLKPAGVLWLVANRHLPYEGPLTEAFGKVDTVTTEGGFKVIQAQRPRRRR